MTTPFATVRFDDGDAVLYVEGVGVYGDKGKRSPDLEHVASIINEMAARYEEQLDLARRMAQDAVARAAVAEAKAARLREALAKAASWGLCPPSTAMARDIQDEYVADSATVRAALAESAP